METHKTCNRCKETLALVEFALAKTGRLGRAAMCKKCFRERYTPELKRRGPSAEYDPVAGTKRCTKCGEMKPLDAYTKRAKGIGGRVSACKTCFNSNKSYRAQTREYVKAHRDRLNKMKSERYQRVKDDPHTKAMYAAAVARRRAQKLKATPPWTTKAMRRKIAVFYLEARQIKNSSGRNTHVDHIVPLQGENICGLHVPWNLRVMPAEENRSKHNRYDGGWANEGDPVWPAASAD